MGRRQTYLVYVHAFVSHCLALEKLKDVWLRFPVCGSNFLKVTYLKEKILKVTIR